MNFKPLIYSVLAGCLIYLFIVNFSLWFWPELNSDHAIHILMTESFNFSKDWYYWGQNRLGSFLPLVGHLIYQLGFSAFNAAAIAQLVLIAGIAFFLWRLIKDGFWLLVALSLLLFPIYPFWMQLSLGHPYLAQFFFICAALFVFYASKLGAKQKYALLPFLFVMAIWSSELSIAAVLAFTIANFKKLLQGLKQYWPFFTSSSVLSVLLLLVAKNQATKTKGYQQLFADFQTFSTSLIDQLNSFLSLFLFRGMKEFNSYLTIGIFCLSILFLVLIILKNRPSPLVVSLLLTSVFSYFMIHLSAWNAQMGMPLRYFTMPYFFYVLSLLVYFAQLKGMMKLKLGLGLTMALLFINASLSFNGRFETGADGRIRPDEAKKLIVLELSDDPNMDSFAVIGSYWNTHLLDALSEGVKGLPFNGEQLRNGNLIKEVDEMEHFILIANGWLSDFPDQILEREWLLEKVGQPKKIDDILYCRYRKIKSYPKL